MNTRIALAVVAVIGLYGTLPAGAEEVHVGVTTGSAHVDRDGDRDRKVVIKDRDRDDKKVVIHKDRDHDGDDKKVIIKKD